MKVEWVKVMATVNIIDYAQPTMAAERALRELHNAMLRKHFNSAKEHALDAVVESKLAYNSILHMQETLV